MFLIEPFNAEKLRNAIIIPDTVRGKKRKALMLSNCLHAELRGSKSHTTRVSTQLRKAIKRFSKPKRKEIVSIPHAGTGNAPLFVACEKGAIEFVKFIVGTCDADVEQKGYIERTDDRTSSRRVKHTVTPLWCAAVCGHLDIVKILIRDYGADVNAISNLTGSNALIGASYQGRFDVVHYLVSDVGQDVNTQNWNGCTSLINSIDCQSLTEFLLQKGANVNVQDVHGMTALLYSVQERFHKITGRLLNSGSDPYIRNQDGDDSFRMACVVGDAKMFMCLLNHTPRRLPQERTAELFELLGAKICCEDHFFYEKDLVVEFWRKSIISRHDPDRMLPEFPKQILDFTPYYLKNDGTGIEEPPLKEFETMGELERIIHDMDKMKLTSIIMTERILGPRHDETISRIMYMKEVFALASDFTRSIRLWHYGLTLRIRKDTLLYKDTCESVVGITRYYQDLDGSRKFDRESLDHPLKVQDILATYGAITDKIAETMELINIKPIFVRQQECFDTCLRCCTHLLYVLIRKPHKTTAEMNAMKAITEKLVEIGPRTCATGDSLLHLSCSKLNLIRTPFYLRSDDYVFPCTEVARYFLECGADVNALNNNRGSPLHYASTRENFSRTLIQELLQYGAHVDQFDKSNQTPLMMLQNRRLLEGLRIPLLDHITLQCLAATAVEGDYWVGRCVPRKLRNFIDLHRPRRSAAKKDEKEILDWSFVSLDMP